MTQIIAPMRRLFAEFARTRAICAGSIILDPDMLIQAAMHSPNMGTITIDSTSSNEINPLFQKMFRHSLHPVISDAFPNETVTVYNIMMQQFIITQDGIDQHGINAYRFEIKPKTANNLNGAVAVSILRE